MALLPFDYELSFTPGHTMCTTEAHSRAPLPSIAASPEESRSMREFVGLVLSAAPVSEDGLPKATTDDSKLASIVHLIVTNAWNNIRPEEEPYFLVRHQLTVVEGIVMFNKRFVIPSPLQLAVLKLAHEGHPGLNTFQDTLRCSVWWPQLTHDATQYASS